MKLLSNYTYHRGWDIEEFEVGEETYLEAKKAGTTIAIQGDIVRLVKILDAIDNEDKPVYNN